MKTCVKYFLVILVLFSAIRTSSAQNPGDKISGIWLNVENQTKIEIFRSSNQYYGKIIWGKTLFEADGKTSKKDRKNPDPKLRNRALYNLVFLTNFTYNGDGTWENGSIYDPKSGKTYSCEMEIKDGRLKMTGYIGFTLLGRTVYWDRVK